MLCCFCVLRSDCESNTVHACALTRNNLWVNRLIDILSSYLRHYRCHIATLSSQLMENLKNLRLIKIWSG
ncbi:uncharacterized protein PHALS_15177 [Plasmopara halstedii]|uniref:Uncharacterized protein n=1 Tax=Plasmopara halstedii TaxID=4781 RepID=A0A0P1B5R4_PLAHL|nr:uncharacterized protein PHALS_15177 [Plasmopara halstedii]CEG48842.1 hypothetical protein PHALS_15177 [Plasmopara halstedii]|eukprot:XP_024585211.1 hypothetical protein PHALS_15177 [Plasmopara halstedii]